LAGALSAGFDQHLTKPVTIPILQEAIASTLALIDAGRCAGRITVRCLGGVWGISPADADAVGNDGEIPYRSQRMQ